VFPLFIERNWLLCGTVVPGKSTKYGQSGQGDDMRNHVSEPSVFFVTPGVQALMNRIFLLIKFSREASGNRFL